LKEGKPIIVGTEKQKHKEKKKEGKERRRKNEIYRLGS
jgi:hypothetical protein